MRRVLTRRLGAHAPAAGGLAKAALPHVDGAAAAAVQVFVSNPRGWALSEGDPKQDDAFVAGCEQRSIPVYVHASLLVNLGSPTAATVENSAAALAHALDRAARIGARAVVFHAGSAVDEGYTATALGQVRDVLLPLLDRDGPLLLVEPSAGGGRSLAARVEDLGPYLEAVGWHPKLGVCFDTCHAWAAGHDLATPGGMTSTLDALVATVGTGRLALVHANDSRDACGSLRDRHETIGVGSLGEAAFAELLAHPSTEGVPVIVETPTSGYAGHGADIATLARLAKPSRQRKRARATPHTRP
jgi:deoxyribonuclease IV